MSTLALLIALSILFVICLVTFFLVGAGSGVNPPAVITFLVSGIAFLVVAVLLLTRAIRSDAQITATIAVLGVMAEGLAWAVKVIRETLFNRAQVLILEYLSIEDLDRSAIRSKIYRDSILFRLNKSIYVDALAALFGNGSIKIVNGEYTTNSGKAESSS